VCFPLNVSMVHSPKLAVINDSKHLTGISFTHGKTIYSGSLEFIADCFGSLSLSDEGNVSSAVFVGMTHSRSPSLHTILEDSANEGGTTSSRGGNSSFPISRGCNMVTRTIPITTIQPSKGTPTP
jgi:hypothetical protein